MSDLKVLNGRSVGTFGTKTSIYVGRPTKWGNPFVLGKDGNRQEVIEMYREYLIRNIDLMSDLDELRGKNLICWCSPRPCHADILLELANR